MRPSSAKAKGRRLQQQVAADLCEAMGLQEDDVRSCAMGANGEDVQLSVAAREKVPWSIECKNQERLNLWSAFAQAESNAKGKTVPVVIAKRNRSDPLCTMRWKDALDLLVRAQARQGEGGSPAVCDNNASPASPASPRASSIATQYDQAPAFLRALADRLEASSRAHGEGD